MLTRADMTYFFNQYLFHPSSYACPLFAKHLDGLPPTLFVVPAVDVLRNRSEYLATRINRSGGNATVRVYPGAIHSFLESMPISKVAQRAIEETGFWLRERIQHRE